MPILIGNIFSSDSVRSLIVHSSTAFTLLVFYLSEREGCVSQTGDPNNLATARVVETPQSGGGASETSAATAAVAAITNSSGNRNMVNLKHLVRAARYQKSSA